MSEEQNTVAEPVLKDEVIVDHGGGSQSISANIADPVDPIHTQAMEMPEKFANADDPQQALLKAYTELEKMKSTDGGTVNESEEAQSEEPTNDKEGDNPVADSDSDNNSSTDTTDSDASEVDVSLEGQYTKLYNEQGGKLTDEQLQTLSQATGETIEGIKEYIEFKKGRTEADIAESDRKVMEAIGGTEEYTKIAEWANDKLPEDKLRAVETMLSNPELAEQGALVLKELYMAQATIEPSLRVDGNGVSEKPDVYMSQAEEIEDMSNPLYKTSPQFRRNVEEKMLRSMKFHSKK